MAYFKLNRKRNRCLLVLPTSIGQTRTGVQESLVLLDPDLVRWTAALKDMLKPEDPFIPGGSWKLRKRFRTLQQDTKLWRHEL